MKKFLLSTCAIAVASLCVFMTSCKDEDELSTVVNTSVNSTQVIAAAITAATNSVSEVAAAASKPGVTVTTSGNTVIAANASTGYTEETTVTTAYTYELNGQTYDSMDQVQAALKSLPAGSSVTLTTTLVRTSVTVVISPTGTRETKPEVVEKKVQITTITIPNEGGTTTIVVKTPVSIATNETSPITITITTTTVSSHSGGAGA